jgi:hypothetical protein
VVITESRDVLTLPLKLTVKLPDEAVV